MKWLNKPQQELYAGSYTGGKGWELAVVTYSFSGYASPEWAKKFYSHPVILVTVPRVADRELTVGK